MKRLIYTFALLFVTLSLFAKTMTGGEILYLNANFWDPNSARFAAYFYGTENKWESMKSIGGGVYEVVVPSGSWTNVIFCRMNNGNQTNDWNNKWNQTGNLTYDGTKNFFKITQWDNQTSGWNSFTWTLVGTSKALFGKEWTPNSNNNLTFEDGKYIKTYSNVELSAGKIEFKVYGDNSSSLAFPSNNVVLNIPSAGYYEITFTFDASKKELKADAKKLFKIPSGGVTLYLYPNSNWLEDNARFALYYFNGSTQNWVSMTKLEDDLNVYSAVIPEGFWEGIIFCRMNPSKLENNFNADVTWNQTSDLTYDGVNNCYIVEEGAWSKGNGKWVIFPTSFIPQNTPFYLKPNSNWESDNARFAVYFFSDFGNTWVDVVDEDGDGIYSGTTPKGYYTNLILCRMNPKFNENGWNQGNESDGNNKVWNQTSDLTYDGENNLFIMMEEQNEKINCFSIKFDDYLKDVVFFKPNSNWKSDNARFAVYFFNNTSNLNSWCDLVELKSHNGYYSAQVPGGIWTNLIFCRMNPTNETNSWDEDNNWNQTGDLAFYSGILYTINDESWDAGTWSIISPNQLEKEIKDGVANGAYYQPKKYTLTISGEDVEKWHWISLPYNVNVKDIKSNITAKDPYGTDFIMKRYDTANRAAWTGKKPPVKDSTWVQLDSTDVLKAGRGYILGVNTSGTYKENGVTLTFPAADDFHVVNDVVTDNNTALSANHPENANWYLIGTGLYGETGTRGGAKPVNYVAYPTESGSDYTYYCFVENDWANLDPAFQKELVGVGKLEKYKAFFVQHSGEYSFSKASTNQSSAPRCARAEEVVEQYYINIVGEKDTARTAIFLADDGTDEYVVGKDFLHFGVTGQTAQLYTKQASSLLAFNHLKRENRVIDLGGYMVNAGEYTISMVDNGEALVVLIDNYTGESVDLTTDSYTFTTEKGSLDGRFSLVISYVEKDVTTEIGNEMAGDLVVSNNGGLVVVDGLSVGSVVWIYDAVGHCVNRFVADSEQQELNICAGVYVLKTSTESVKFVVW